VSIPIPLPGVYLLLVLLFVNLALGTILRIRRTWAKVGLYVAHLGIVVLLVGSMVSYAMAEHGQLTVFEASSGRGLPSQSSEFRSHYDWEIAIYEYPERGAGKGAGEIEEHIIPGSDFLGIGRDGSRRFSGADLPFELVLSRVLPNCAPVPAAAAPLNAIRPFLDDSGRGMVLDERPRATEAAENRAGCYVHVFPKGDGDPETGILWGEPSPPWGRQAFPFLVEIDGRRWALDLRKREIPLPFSIRLTKAIEEKHPGTGMPKSYRSEVQMIEPGSPARDIEISMNEPLRHEGYTLYQSSMGSFDTGRGVARYSGFSVVNNPADDVPLIACIIICSGLLFHFVVMLFRYVSKEMERRS
jgi:hypothetical protein